MPCINRTCVVASQVVFTEDLEEEPVKTLEEVLDFIGLDMVDPQGDKVETEIAENLYKPHHVELAVDGLDLHRWGSGGDAGWRKWCCGVLFPPSHSLMTVYPAEPSSCRQRLLLSLVRAPPLTLTPSGLAEPRNVERHRWREVQHGGWRQEEGSWLTGDNNWLV